MHFDESVETKFVLRGCAQFCQRTVVESCYDQKHSIRTGSSRFIDLDLIDDKIFAQKRKGRARANVSEIENRPAKVFLVCQHRDSTRATALITSVYIGRRQITADCSCGWRAALEFRDDLDSFCLGLQRSQ